MVMVKLKIRNMVEGPKGSVTSTIMIITTFLENTFLLHEGSQRNIK